MPIASPGGGLAGEVGEGNRKDIRNAVEAARKAAGWGSGDASKPGADPLLHRRESRAPAAAEFADRLRVLRGVKSAKTRLEVDASIERLFAFAAWADKYDGAVHRPPLRGLALAMNEAGRRGRHRLSGGAARSSPSSR